MSGIIVEFFNGIFKLILEIQSAPSEECNNIPNNRHVIKTEVVKHLSYINGVTILLLNEKANILLLIETSQASCFGTENGTYNLSICFPSVGL